MKKYDLDDLQKRLGGLTISKIVAFSRKNLGLSQHLYSKQLGISQTFLFNLEHGLMLPSPEMCIKLAKKLGMSEIVMLECLFEEKYDLRSLNYSPKFKKLRDKL